MRGCTCLTHVVLQFRVDSERIFSHDARVFNQQVETFYFHTKDQVYRTNSEYNLQVLRLFFAFFFFFHFFCLSVKIAIARHVCQSSYAYVRTIQTRLRLFNETSQTRADYFELTGESVIFPHRWTFFAVVFKPGSLDMYHDLVSKLRCFVGVSFVFFRLMLDTPTCLRS